MSNSRYSELYRDAFNIHKKYSEPHDWHDRAYWDAFDAEMNALYDKYKTPFAFDFLSAVWNEIERTVNKVYP